MKWEKLGKIYEPSRKFDWNQSHAANPVAELIHGDFFRVYFSTRDQKNRSSIGYVVIDLSDPCSILEEAQKPVLSFGEIGMPDDSGASIGCITPVDGGRYLYYMGWQLTVTVPWRNTIGLAIAGPDRNDFRRHSSFPIINLDEKDPYTISYPWVMPDGDTFRMWYGSNLRWGPNKMDMLHVIKYAESVDGINWIRPNIICINSVGPHDYAICKPCVIKDHDVYKMWFCHRGESYRIGYAESIDGIKWERLDHLSGIDTSTAGWDSEMIEYPFVFDHKGERYMLYAGNGFGKTGFGLAILLDQ